MLFVLSFKRIFGCFYKANKGKTAVFTELFDDSNPNKVEQSNRANSIMRLCQMHALELVSYVFTRITHDSRTKIYYALLTNIDKRISCYSIQGERINNPETVKISKTKELKINFKDNQTVLSWQNYNAHQLNKYLFKCDWMNFNDSDIDRSGKTNGKILRSSWNRIQIQKRGSLKN